VKNYNGEKHIPSISVLTLLLQNRTQLPEPDHQHPIFISWNTFLL